MPPTAAAANPSSVVLQGRQQRSRQHRPVIDGAFGNRARSGQHVGRNIVGADHEFPCCYYRPTTHDDGSRIRTKCWVRLSGALCSADNRGVAALFMNRTASGAARQRVRNLAAIAGIVGRGTKVLVARLGGVDAKLVSIRPGPRCHHHHALRQLQPTQTPNGDEDDGLAQFAP